MRRQCRATPRKLATGLGEDRAHSVRLLHWPPFRAQRRCRRGLARLVWHSMPARPSGHFSIHLLSCSTCSRWGCAGGAGHIHSVEMPELRFSVVDAGSSAMRRCEACRAFAQLCPLREHCCKRPSVPRSVVQHLVCALCLCSPTHGTCSSCGSMCCRGSIEEATCQCCACLGNGEPQAIEAQRLALAS